MKELMMKMLLLNNMNYMLNRTSDLIVFEPFIGFNLNFRLIRSRLAETCCFKKKIFYTRTIASALFQYHFHKCLGIFPSIAECKCSRLLDLTIAEWPSPYPEHW